MDKRQFNNSDIFVEFRAIARCAAARDAVESKVSRCAAAAAACDDRGHSVTRVTRVSRCLRANEDEEGEEYERRDSSGQNAETTNTVGVRLSLSGTSLGWESNRLLVVKKPSKRQYGLERDAKGYPNPSSSAWDCASLIRTLIMMRPGANLLY